ncbi:MFS transporter [Steroidobacter cummioxidans]|uniref:MFS transporter n=1 Tax=Steroidobacter cummioxidans TaxID=1803913 RepID=UPI001F4DE8B1|nr:MFS transporter [Steroidobacter cummioxidans]
MNSSAEARDPASWRDETVFPVIVAISCCHLLNDTMQSLMQASYPALKASHHLTFAELGWISLAYQMTASMLQPVVGYVADRRPAPFSLPAGTLFTALGLLVISLASNFEWLLAGAAMLGMGSSVFHPEASRVARMAAGDRHSLAQSLFQLGGNAGQAIGPLLAALVVVQWGQSSLAAFALLTLVSTAILWNISVWYKHHGLPRLQRAHAPRKQESPIPRATVVRGMTILLILIFSKFAYASSLTNYYTFYLIERFHMSVAEAQVHLFLFLGSVATGTLLGGYFGDRFTRKAVIRFSVLGALPLTIMLPYVSLQWTEVLTVLIGLTIASAFPAIVVFAQELLPTRVGMVSGMMFGFSFGVGGLAAASFGHLADVYGIALVYKISAWLPLLGVLAIWLPDAPLKRRELPTDR